MLRSRWSSRAVAMLASSAIGIAQGPDRPPRLPRELRGAWVATVANIDWPSRKGLSTAQQQKELTRILDRARSIRLNALIFQVRPSCDAFYPSPLEPWSEWLTGTQGEAPEPAWDPLQFAIDGCHERGMELHAWFNPFRAHHLRSQSRSSSDHVVVRHPQWIASYGTQLWLDPGIPEARDHSQRVVLDVVRRYDIDAVHLDDYFYPYPENDKAFPDGLTYRAYQQRDGRLSLADWRRSNVDTFVSDLHSGSDAPSPGCNSASARSASPDRASLRASRPASTSTPSCTPTR